MSTSSAQSNSVPNWSQEIRHGHFPQQERHARPTCCKTGVLRHALCTALSDPIPGLCVTYSDKDVRNSPVGRELSGRRSLRRSQSTQMTVVGSALIRQSCVSLSNYMQLTEQRLHIAQAVQDYSQGALIFAIGRCVWSTQGYSPRRRLSRLLKVVHTSLTRDEQFSSLTAVSLST